MKCPNCGSRVKRGDDICPICDYQLKKSSKQSGIDENTTHDYKVIRIKTADEIRFNKQFKQEKTKHSEETVAERYSCRDHDKEYDSYINEDGEIITPVQLTREDVGDFNFNKYLIISIIIMMFGLMPFGMVCLFLAISAKKNYENENYTSFASFKRGFTVMAVISIILSVIFVIPYIAFAILSINP